METTKRRIAKSLLTLRNGPAPSLPAPVEDKIASALALGEPIQLVLPAFPAKSPNQEKTLGALPDLGEVLALVRLQKLCNEIRAVYPPGARLVICSDGRVFSDLVHVSDADVNAYALGIRKIISANGLTDLSTFNLEEVFPEATYDQMRASLVDTSAQPLERIREKVKSDVEWQKLFNGLHRFLFEDFLVLHGGLSRNGVRALAKQQAYEVLQRSQAWSALVAARFPKALRLSIHPQSRRSEKVPICMVPGRDTWMTPWHSVVLFDGGKYFLVKRREAETLGAHFAYSRSGHGYYFLGGRHAVGD